MPQKILLFDFDGTIADTADVAVQIYNDIAQEQGYPLITKENLATLKTRSAMENIRAFGIPIYRLPFLVKRVQSRLASDGARLHTFEGIPDALKKLKRHGYTLAIVSSNSVENIKRFLSHNHLTEFDDVYSVSNLFGKHRKIKALIKQHGWSPADVKYIGDEARDLEAAKQAGIESIAVTWGYNEEQLLKKHRPSLILRHPSELGSL